MSVTGDPHMPGNCWCGRQHVLTDAIQPLNPDFPELYRPLNPMVSLGVLPLSEQRIREIIREEIKRASEVSG